MTAAAPVHTRATLRYIAPGCDGGILYEMQRESSTLEFDPRVVAIQDGRSAAAPPTLETHGFALVHSPVTLEPADFVPEGFMKPGSYGQQMADLVKRMTGASEVLVFNQLIRDEDDAVANKPAHTVHVDFDRETLEGFIRGVAPSGEDLLKKRFSNINLWRAMTTVERTPLAVCEGSTIARQDLRVGHIKMKPGMESPPMSGFNIAYSPDHRWWCFPRMQPDEVLVFRLYDSDPDRVALAAHTAFEDPTSPANAPPRRSLEVRTIAFFD